MSDIATRAGYGETLVELAAEGVDVMAVEADLSGSTTTKKLGEAYPERLVNVGIAEQNMIDVAAGLSLAGKVAFTGSFAAFGTGRCYDQIRNTVCYANLDVKVAPTHSGVTVMYAADWAEQYPDIYNSWTMTRENDQVVDYLERDGRGLNLCEETRLGILHHTHGAPSVDFHHKRLFKAHVAHMVRFVNGRVGIQIVFVEQTFASEGVYCEIPGAKRS